MDTMIQTQSNAPESGQKKAARKRVPSKLEPFTDELLRMDAEKKTLQEMQDWLKAREVETSLNNVSVFLVRRRAKEQFDGEKGPIEAFEEWADENPHASAERVMERFKMLALGLSLKKDAAPETLRLADRLATTTIRFVNAQSRVANDRSREDYRQRKLLMEEAKHMEWVKCEQTRALQLCLAEAKKSPEVAKLFRTAFVALKELRSKVLWRQDGTYPHPNPNRAE